MESLDNGHVVLPSDFAESILTGEHVRIHPWARGCYARDMLYFLWKMMENEGMTNTVFYERTSTEDKMPISTEMDLIEFCHYFSSVSNRLLLIPQHIETQEVMGFAWYDGVILGVSGKGSMFYRKKFWGEMAKEASTLCLKYGFEILGFQKVWGLSPWQASVKHRARLGFKEVAEVPDAFQDAKGKSRSMYVGVCTKESFNGRTI